jgi:hypothetical protein
MRSESFVRQGGKPFRLCYAVALIAEYQRKLAKAIGSAPVLLQRNHFAAPRLPEMIAPAGSVAPFNVLSSKCVYLAVVPLFECPSCCPMIGSDNPALARTLMCCADAGLAS